MSKPIGGFAFPTHFNGNSPPDNGMTLRDYFAAKAMQGMLANPNPPQSDEHMLVRDAYTVADAMLAERAK